MAGLFMNAFGSMVYDSSVTQAGCWGDSPGSWPGLPAPPGCFPCEPHLLADLILSPGEREHWASMRGVEKRRREWLLGRCVAKEAVRALLERNLDLHLSPAEIEIVPDPYGRPLVSVRAAPGQPAVRERFSPPSPSRTARAPPLRWRSSIRKPW